MLGHDESLRVRQTYDHRLRDAIAATGNADLFQNIEIPVLVATVNCTFVADENCTLGTRPVQKHKRTQDWCAGPFRSSSTHGEPQIWGVSEAMSAIRVPRTRRENTVQQRDATLPGGDLDPGPGCTWTRTC